MIDDDKRLERVGQIERGLDRVADFVSWIWIVLVLLIVLTVIMRFVFGSGRIELEELQWHLYAVGFLTGIVGCTGQDRHIRVDVFRERMPERTRSWIDLYGILLLQIPFVLLVIWSAIPFVADSFASAERSSSAGGLPFRWLLKGFLPTSMLLLFLATSARLVRVWHALFFSSSAAAKAEVQVEDEVER